MDRPDPMRLGVCLELVQDPAAHSKAARRFDHPHTLQLGGLFSVELERAAADRFFMEGGDEEETGRRAHFFVVGGEALWGGRAPFSMAGPPPRKGRPGKTGGGGGRGEWARL